MEEQRVIFNDDGSYSFEDVADVVEKQEFQVRKYLGGLPFSVMARANELGPHCLAILIAIEVASRLKWQSNAAGYVPVTSKVGEEIGVTHVRKRLTAIERLEAAGMIEVYRQPNMAPRCKVVPFDKADTGKVYDLRDTVPAEQRHESKMLPEA